MDALIEVEPREDGFYTRFKAEFLTEPSHYCVQSAIPGREIRVACGGRRSLPRSIARKLARHGRQLCFVVMGSRSRLKGGRRGERTGEPERDHRDTDPDRPHRVHSPSQLPNHAVFGASVPQILMRVRKIGVMERMRGGGDGRRRARTIRNSVGW